VEILGLTGSAVTKVTSDLDLRLIRKSRLAAEVGNRERQKQAQGRPAPVSLEAYVLPYPGKLCTDSDKQDDDHGQSEREEARHATGSSVVISNSLRVTLTEELLK
jgi:hypothetical protein